MIDRRSGPLGPRQGLLRRLLGEPGSLAFVPLHALGGGGPPVFRMALGRIERLPSLDADVSVLQQHAVPALDS